MKRLRYGLVLLLFCSRVHAADIISSPIAEGRIAFSLLRGEESGIASIDFSSKRLEILVPISGVNEFPSFSPDGKKLAFYSDRSGNREIYVMDLERKETKQLTHWPGADEDPNWSADGKRIVISRETARNEMNLFEIALESGEEHQLTKSRGRNTVPKISPNGAEVLYSTSAHWPGWDLMLLKRDLKTEQLTSGVYTYCRANWEPSGKGYAYSYGIGHETDIWVRRDGNDTQLTDRPGREYDAEWLPDGDRLFYTGEGTPGKGDFQLFLLDVPRKKSVQITRGNEAVRYLSFTSLESRNAEMKR